MNLSLPSLMFKSKMVNTPILSLAIIPMSMSDGLVALFAAASILFVAARQWWKYKHPAPVLDYQERLKNYEDDVRKEFNEAVPFLDYDKMDVLSISFDYVLNGASDPQGFYNGPFIDYLRSHIQIYSLAVVDETFINRKTEPIITDSLKENGYLMIMREPDNQGHTKLISIKRKKSYYGR